MSGRIDKGPLFATWGEGTGWFTLFRLGLGYTDHRKIRPFLSERYAGKYGFPKSDRMHIGPWCFDLVNHRKRYGR